MLNILSYIGVSLQSELCLWTLLGLLRTIFDATLFKVNANLKQVWLMNLPPELSLPVQGALRTMISGVMLVQCFTLYVYLASYIVLLYPVFLEERPTLALPWLLLAAVRRFLCELTSLTIGLGACILLGPVRPPCIKFVVLKIASITPAFYMWMLVYSYYNTLKVTATFKRFPTVMAPEDNDYGLELAVRRRRTKSLQDENQLRKKLVASFDYRERSLSQTIPSDSELKSEITVRMAHSTHAIFEDIQAEMNESPFITPLAEKTTSDFGAYEDWCGSMVVVPRDTDRILEQFSIMMLRIGAYLNAEQGTDPEKLFTASDSHLYKNIDTCSTIQGDVADTPPQVGNTTKKTVNSYLEEYPQIFNKKPDSLQFQNDQISNVIPDNEIERTTSNCSSESQNKTVYQQLPNKAKAPEDLQLKHILEPQNLTDIKENSQPIREQSYSINATINTEAVNKKDQEHVNLHKASQLSSHSTKQTKELLNKDFKISDHEIEKDEQISATLARDKNLQVKSNFEDYVNNSTRPETESTPNHEIQVVENNNEKIFNQASSNQSNKTTKANQIFDQLKIKQSDTQIHVQETPTQVEEDKQSTPDGYYVNTLCEITGTPNESVNEMNNNENLESEKLMEVLHERIPNFIANKDSVNRSSLQNMSSTSNNTKKDGSDTRGGETTNNSRAKDSKSKQDSQEK